MTQISISEYPEKKRKKLENKKIYLSGNLSSSGDLQISKNISFSTNQEITECIEQNFADILTIETISKCELIVFLGGTMKRYIKKAAKKKNIPIVNSYWLRDVFLYKRLFDIDDYISYDYEKSLYYQKKDNMPKRIHTNHVSLVSVREKRSKNKCYVKRIYRKCKGSAKSNFSEYTITPMNQAFFINSFFRNNPIPPLGITVWLCKKCYTFLKRRTYIANYQKKVCGKYTQLAKSYSLFKDLINRELIVSGIKVLITNLMPRLYEVLENFTEKPDLRVHSSQISEIQNSLFFDLVELSEKIPKNQMLNTLEIILTKYFRFARYSLMNSSIPICIHFFLKKRKIELEKEVKKEFKDNYRMAFKDEVFSVINAYKSAIKVKKKPEKSVPVLEKFFIEKYNENILIDPLIIKSLILGYGKQEKENDKDIETFYKVLKKDGKSLFFSKLFFKTLHVNELKHKYLDTITLQNIKYNQIDEKNIFLSFEKKIINQKDLYSINLLIYYYFDLFFSDYFHEEEEGSLFFLVRLCKFLKLCKNKIKRRKIVLRTDERLKWLTVMFKNNIIYWESRHNPNDEDGYECLLYSGIFMLLKRIWGLKKAIKKTNLDFEKNQKIEIFIQKFGKSF